MADRIDFVFQTTARLTLREAYQKLGGNQPTEIPRIVRLFENPKSPFALPGKISLHNHDCLHILLGRQTTNLDEAFVIGFTMGNDTNTRWFHVYLFKLISYLLYPSLYKFSRAHFRVFDLGYLYGKRLRVKNLNRFDFIAHYSKTVEALRLLLGIDIHEIKLLEKFEYWLCLSQIHN